MPEVLTFILLLIAAYLFGSIPVAFIAVKLLYKVDLRNYGSGGVGGSNVFRSFSKPLGIVVGVFDGIKGLLMVWIAMLLGFSTAFQVLIGLAVICGHNWPVFLRFNAGRGLATSLGVCFIIFPWGIWVFVAGALFTLLLGSSPLPSLIGMAAMPVTAALLGKPSAVTLGLLAIFLLLIFRRLSAPIPESSKSIPKKSLYWNRFLFDRDQRSQKPWNRFAGKKSADDSKTGKPQ
jgi:acyl phosphate:glycerol-3-phosphate acyltransferase